MTTTALVAPHTIAQRLNNLSGTIRQQFHNRTVCEGEKCDNAALKNQKLDIEITKDAFWMTFSNGEESHSVSFPIPYRENGVEFIQSNEVVRATCGFWREKDALELDYIGVMHTIIMSDCTGLVSVPLVKKSFYLQQMIYGFCNGNASIIANRFQKAINEVVNKLPLHETMLNSWVMNQRLIIIDPEFDEIKSPTVRLEYQRKKAEKYFGYGWTALGLSDGVLADKNYILKTDVRRLSPFGMRFHNPQRNLYSTLGMKGDELPRVRSASMQALMDQGISRHGWNLVTAFVDIPDVFEDQIVVDNSLRDKYVTYERRFQVFGDMLVREGQIIKTGQPIGTSKGNRGPKTFDLACDWAKVTRVHKSKVNVGGNKTDVYNVIVEYRRKFRDGLKLTNLHGNKGVIRIRDLGYAIHPVTEEKVKLQVVVGAKTVGKRRNYGQILEALFNNTMDVRGFETEEDNPIRAFHKKFGGLCGVKGFSREPQKQDAHVVLPDEWYQPIGDIHKGLVNRGFRYDGTWDCDTYAGKVTAVVGKVFWGCIKTPEDQIWEDGETEEKNGKELRTKGLKFSHVEFKALKTRFGDENPVMDEILSYAQGTENLHELTQMVKSKQGQVPAGKATVSVANVRPLDQSFGTILPERLVGGTVVDEFFMPDGFVMTLPLPFQTIINERGKVLHEGAPSGITTHPEATVLRKFETDRLYIPSGIMRKCWRHENGMYGLSEIGVLVNNVVVMARKLIVDPESEVNYNLYYSMLYRYFTGLSEILCSKRGEIATLGMSVRFPFSAKAVAAQAPELPKNTVEIHRDMARVLNVHDGEVVIAERFPCLGFMSVRLQRVKITDNEMCRYVIRVSGNSLVSQNLDHDGDVLYLAAMQTPEAKLCLRKEFDNPNQTCYSEIEKLNNRKGAPHIKCYGLDDFKITPFADLTCEEHATIVEKNTGVKAQTGPVIALTYNLMRIVENSDIAHNQKAKVAIEMFLEKAAQSVFEQKHGGKSLYEIVIDGVCTADVEMLVGAGFKRGITEKLCNVVRHKAMQLGIFNLVAYHEKAKAQGRSNVISAIVREQNQIYFASRARLEGVNLLEALDSKAVDTPSEIFCWVMSGKSLENKTTLEEMIEERKLSVIKSSAWRRACKELFGVLETTCISDKTDKEDPLAHMRARMRRLSVYRGISHAQIA